MITCPCCNHTFTPEAPASAVTPRQSELLAFIAKYLEAHGGIAPTYDEMKAALGLSSKGAINRLVRGLEDKGLIRRRPKAARAIIIVGEATC